MSEGICEGLWGKGETNYRLCMDGKCHGNKWNRVAFPEALLCPGLFTLKWNWHGHHALTAQGWGALDILATHLLWLRGIEVNLPRKNAGSPSLPPHNSQNPRVWESLPESTEHHWMRKGRTVLPHYISWPENSDPEATLPGRSQPGPSINVSILAKPGEARWDTKLLMVRYIMFWCFWGPQPL